MGYIARLFYAIVLYFLCAGTIYLFCNDFFFANTHIRPYGTSMYDWNSRNPPYWAWRVAREKSTNAASCEDRTVVFEESWYAGVLQFEVSQHATVSAAPLSLETSQSSAKLRICTQDIREYVPRWLIRRQRVVHTSVRSPSHSTE
ncbi:predicted protein [Histoplasma capsulatum G186AR]|uniref:Uncharacterized protein n=1 Tax=Ajellomyces capsulatus (strain G186AR / H82 / ATCC MYA-2454 / RMSCC 2432) TaxID=447093 RepID=C0NIZ8_AJECG|nr:uncharacterized protein HCBG_03128 [Histoplasma capsulatum G186AR]EEH07839.1 predicted protein [Histoplasma capsulatum G186AR]